MRLRRPLAISLSLLFLLAALPAPALALPAAGAASLPMQWSFVSKFGTWGSEPGKLYFPTHIAMGQEGTRVWVNDAAQHRINVFGIDGSGPATFGSLGSGTSQFNRPEGIASDRWGWPWIADMGNRRAVLYAPWGTMLGGFSTQGITAPYTLAVAPDEEVFVTDTTKVERYEKDGTRLASWETTMTRIMGSATDLDGNLYVVADGQMGTWPGHLGDRVIEYSPDGEYLRSWGESGTALGQLYRPCGVKVDPVGRVYVADTGNHRVQVFDKDGTLLSCFGYAGSADGLFSAPYDVAVGSHRDLYVVDASLSRVQSFTTTVSTVYDEIKGDDRIGTAVEISKRTYPRGTGVVIIATAYNWPDALAASALAGSKHAPILLTSGKTLSTAVADEIGRLGATKAIIVGGTSSVSGDVYEALVDKGMAVQRIGGESRFQTASMIASEAVAGHDVYDWFETAFLATGSNYPDALAVSPISAANGMPLYLANNGATLSTATVAAMKAAGVKYVKILGDENAIPLTMEQQLQGEFVSVVRKAGANRYATAATIAWTGIDEYGMATGDVAIARGDNYPDALAAGPMQGKRAQVMLLAKPSSLPSETAAFLAGQKSGVYGVRFLGGLPSLSQVTRDAIKKQLF